MTQHINARPATLAPVRFMLYNLCEYGKYKGKPNLNSFIGITLMRDLSKAESVPTTVERLKTMISKDTHFKLESAIETDEERMRRRTLNELVPITTPVNVHAAASATTQVEAPKVVNDDFKEHVKKHTKPKAAKKLAEANVEAQAAMVA